MADSNSSHQEALNADSGRLQETVQVSEDDNAQIPVDEDDHVFLSRTDGNYTTVPTSDTHSLSSGKGTIIDAPELEKDELPPQRVKEKLIVLRSWRFELLALLTGILSFASIIAILVRFNDEAQLEFARHVNINTIVAILSTTLRAVIAFIATEVIGQSKWGWLETSRPLRHGERLDNAGRGAWGSIKFLFFVSKPSSAVMGALLMIASYVLDPFSQQLVKTYSCNIPSDEEASIFVARRVYAYNLSERPLMWLAATTGLAGLGLSYSMADTSKSQLFQCLSGNRTFPMQSNFTHTSVGLCSTCTDVSSDLMEMDLGNQRMRYQFPRQPELNLTWPQPDDYFRARTSMNSQLFMWASDTNHATLSTTSIITFSTAICRNHNETSRIYNKRRCRKIDSRSASSEWEKDPHMGIIAVNCSLSPCLRRYRGEVSLGTLKEELVSQERMGWSNMNESLDGPEARSWYIKFDPCEVKGRWYDSSNITKAPTDSTWVSWRDGESSWNRAPKNCLMGLGSWLLVQIASFQQEVIQGDIGNTITAESATWLPALARQLNATFESISASFDGMATGYTDFMRGNWEEIQNERLNVDGVNYKSAICIRADWPWLVYPAVLLVWTTILLVAAVFYSMRGGGKRPVWKSTILPFLFYNLKMNRDHDRGRMDEDDADVPLLQLRELETLADKTVVRFRTDAAAPEFIVENGGAGGGGASAGQQAGLLRRLFKPRPD